MSITIAEIPDPRTPGQSAPDAYAFARTVALDMGQGSLSVTYQVHPDASAANASGQPITSINLGMTGAAFVAFATAHASTFAAFKAALDEWACTCSEIGSATVNP